MRNEDTPAGSAAIAPSEMYAEIRATHEAVVDIRRHLVELAKILPDHESRLRDLERVNVASTVADQEDRIRRLERALWKAASLAGAAGVAASQAIDALLK